MNNEINSPLHIGKCPRCGGLSRPLVFSNNPLIDQDHTMCYDCLATYLDYKNLNQAEFFCRTYNLPWFPALWQSLVDVEHLTGGAVFKTYNEMVLTATEEDIKKLSGGKEPNIPLDFVPRKNLFYGSSTADLWSLTNKEWEKAHSFYEILCRLPAIKDSYIARGKEKWGQQYDFSQLIALDNLYSQTLKANNVTNPLQKQAVRTLCKLSIEIDQAIQAGDSKSLKELSTSYSTFAKQADLETMISETKTDDILTVADLYDYMERQGFKFTYYSGFPKDEVDQALKDINDSNRRLILEANGAVSSTLEEMTKSYAEKLEAKRTTDLQANPTEMIMNLLDEQAESIETEEDGSVIAANFEDDESSKEE